MIFIRLKFFYWFVILKILKQLNKISVFREWFAKFQYIYAVGAYEANMRLYALKWQDAQNILNKNNQVAEQYVSYKNIKTFCLFKECSSVSAYTTIYTYI